MPGIKPRHLPLSRLLTAQGHGSAMHLPSLLSSVGELPMLDLPQLTPKRETMGVRASPASPLPLGCAHFLPAGCLRKSPCPGTVRPGLCFPRGPLPWSQCTLWSQHDGRGTPPSHAMSWTPFSSGADSSMYPPSPVPQSYTTASIKREALGVREVGQECKKGVGSVI